MKKLKWVSWHRQASRAHCSTPIGGYDIPFETAVIRTKKSATVDDDILRSFVFQYKNALKEGKSQREALERSEDIALKAAKEGLWPEGNLEILRLAMEAGELAWQALNPVTAGLYERDKSTLNNSIGAVQEMVKANPVVLDLPFIRDVMCYILRELKYGAEGTKELKDAWVGFISDRHGLEKLRACPESLRQLVIKAKKEGVKVDTGDDISEGPAAVAYRFGVSESKFKKYTADKNRGRGRPKKKG